jgi:hypothetical protein
MDRVFCYKKHNWHAEENVECFSAQFLHLESLQYQAKLLFIIVLFKNSE